MSAEVVIPTKLPQPNSRVGPSKNTKPGTSASSQSSSSDRTSTVSNRFNRFRPSRKPEIQVDKNELKQKLTPLQYKVTQEKFTERPFSGEYLRLNDKGVYCCIVCGEEIFSSETKYDSGCGWPAFFNSIKSEKLILQTDLSHVGGNLLLLALNQDLARTEVTCAKCGSHLGHVFDDGPRPTGKRYCVNSASLKFKKANGEEVICDIPSNGSCCFRSPTRTNSSSSNENDIGKEIKTDPLLKPFFTTNVKGSKPVDIKPRLAPKSRIETKQVKTKSLSPTSRTEARTTTAATTTPIYSSSHARRVQMDKEDFFKSPTSTIITNPRTKNSEIESKTNNNFICTNTSKPVLNRIKKISSTFGESGNEDSNFTIKSDMNNNKTAQTYSKYNDVKSRYLNHLDSLGKKSVIKHTFGPKKPSSYTMAEHTIGSNTTILESDL